MGRSAGAASFFALGGIVGGGRRRCDREWLGFLVGSGGGGGCGCGSSEWEKKAAGLGCEMLWAPFLGGGFAGRGDFCFVPKEVHSFTFSH